MNMNPYDGKTHYEVLELNQDADYDKIKKAYHKLALQHHPDKGGNAEDFKIIVNAYNILSNHSTRDEYDSMLPSSRSAYNPKPNKSYFGKGSGKGSGKGTRYNAYGEDSVRVDGKKSMSVDKEDSARVDEEDSARVIENHELKLFLSRIKTKECNGNCGRPSELCFFWHGPGDDTFKYSGKIYTRKNRYQIFKCGC